MWTTSTAASSVPPVWYLNKTTLNLNTLPFGFNRATGTFLKKQNTLPSQLPIGVDRLYKLLPRTLDHDEDRPRVCGGTDLLRSDLRQNTNSVSAKSSAALMRERREAAPLFLRT